MSEAGDPTEALDPAEIALTAAPAGPGILLCECFFRDALGEGTPLPATAGIALVERLVGCGFRRIEVASFGTAGGENPSPAEAVLRGVRRRPGVTFTAECPDRTVLRRALDARDAGWGPEEISLPVSASEAEQRNRLQRSREEQWAELAEMVVMAGGAFVLTGTIGGAFDGRGDPQRVPDDAERFAALGITRIAIEDATGSATPPRVRDLIGWLHGALPTATFIARFGDRRGTGIANTLAAIEAGLTHADCALGGGAGPEAGGNASTEDLALALHAMGFATGLDLDRVREAGLAAEQLLGRRLRSRTLRTAEAEPGASPSMPG